MSRSVQIGEHHDHVGCVFIGLPEHWREIRAAATAELDVSYG